MNHIDKIIRLPIKEAFKYEDRHFTPWLTDNIDVISEAISIDLTNAEREQSTGSFSVDIKAETMDGRIVVIENQYGNSDHGHLGKLLTYKAAFEAEIAVWIVEDARTEHINVVSWLNESDNQCDFFLLKIEAIKIGESKIAPLLTLIIGPSAEAKVIGKVKKEDAERNKLRFEFWTRVLEKCREMKLKTFDGISPRKGTWMGSTSGVKGFKYNFWVNQHTSWIELRIDFGQGMDEANSNALNVLKENQKSIEKSFGSELSWDDPENERVCGVRKVYDNGGYKDETWEQTIELMVSGMQSLIKSTSKYIK